MHYLTIVVLPPGPVDDVGKAVNTALAPFDEELEVEEYEEDGEKYWSNPAGLWDWWQIGGRWTGHLYPDYDPAQDPRNQEYDRNGKLQPKWPTQWAAYHGDVARLGDVRHILGTDEGRPYHLVHEGVTSAQRYNPDGDFNDPTNPMFVDTSKDVLDVIATLSDDCTVVVVDIHR